MKHVRVVKQSDTLYEAVTRNFMDGFWIVDMVGNFLSVNKAFCHLVGYSKRELLDMNISQLEVGKKSKDVIGYLSRVTKMGGDRSLTQYRQKRGKIIDIEVSASYTKESGGRISALVRDVRQQKQEEEEAVTVTF